MSQPESLKSACFSNICVHLWTTNWPKNGVLTIEQVNSLHMPPSFTEFIKTRVLEIAKWVEKHSNVIPCNQRLLQCLKWDNWRNIDCQGTLDHLFNGNIITADQKFSLAAIYCKEADIQRLWGEVSAQHFQAYTSVVSYWTWMCSDRRHHFAHALVYVSFREALQYGWIDAVRYFYSQIESEEEKTTMASEGFWRAISERDWDMCSQVWNLVPAEQHEQLTIAASQSKYGRPDVDLCVAIADAGSRFTCTMPFVNTLLTVLPLIDRQRLLWADGFKVFRKSVQAEQENLTIAYMEAARRSGSIDAMLRAENYQGYMLCQNNTAMMHLIWIYASEQVRTEIFQKVNMLDNNMQMQTMLQHEEKID